MEQNHTLRPKSPPATLIRSTIYRFEIRLPVVRRIFLRLHSSMLDLHAGRLVDMEKALNAPPPGP